MRSLDCITQVFFYCGHGGPSFTSTEEERERDEKKMLKKAIGEYRMEIASAKNSISWAREKITCAKKKLRDLKKKD